MNMGEKILDILSEVCEDDIILHEMNIELIESGILDSMGRVEFIVEIEDKLGVYIQPTEIDWKVVNTPKKIVEYILNLK